MIGITETDQYMEIKFIYQNFNVIQCLISDLRSSVLLLRAEQLNLKIPAKFKFVDVQFQAACLTQQAAAAVK